ncbi:Imm27 family immunity protein [Leptospira interrogans]|uniref:Imm27 family immunity protein n=1 Tax=Leptospira interrogans TaxID=173 RepID=UPI0007741B09|nr:Imm27 family immunity protein [Leptospira interrogans]
MIKKILPSEKELVGSWIKKDSGIQNDEILERAIYLMQNYLIKIKADSSGWNTLYQDPVDGRYWEATYPQSDIHGSGPLTLFVLSDNHAKKKFKLS